MVSFNCLCDPVTVGGNHELRDAVTAWAANINGDTVTISQKWLSPTTYHQILNLAVAKCCF